MRRRWWPLIVGAALGPLAWLIFVIADPERAQRIHDALNPFYH